VRIEWTCEPARAAALSQRVLEEIRFVRTTTLSRNQVASLRENLLRESETNSQDNGYLLNQISRRYQDGDAGHVAAAVNPAAEIAALTGADLQQAAQTYLDTTSYVKVTLMPQTK
jgi:Tfp pilus assembly protein PilV